MANLVRNDSFKYVKDHLISINNKIPKLNRDCLCNMHWLQQQLTCSQSPLSENKKCMNLDNTVEKYHRYFKYFYFHRKVSMLKNMDKSEHVNITKWKTSWPRNLKMIWK